MEDGERHITDQERAIRDGRLVYDQETDTWYEASTWASFNFDPIRRGELTVARPEYLKRPDGQALIYPGRRHSFFGPSESLKSWAALLAAKEVLAAGRTALYVDFEDDAISFYERAVLVGIPEAALGRALRYIRPDEPLRGRAETDLRLLASDLDPALVVIDGVTEAMTLHGWHPYDPKDAADYQHLLLRGYGSAAVIEIDHTSKDSGRGQLGSQQKRAGLDGASYEFEVVKAAGRGGHSVAEMKVSKDRHGYVRHFATNGVAATFNLDTTPGHDGPAVYLGVLGGWAPVLSPVDLAYDRVIEWVRANPKSSSTTIEGAVPGSTEFIRKALRRAEAEGEMFHEPGPRGAKLWSVKA